MVNEKRGIPLAKSGEPSVEEILESIKNVMERDSRASASEAQRRRLADSETTTETAASDEEEVLDLAEMELSEVVELEDDAQDSEAPLIAEEARGAMQENLAALAMLAQPGAKPQIVRSGETSLEGLTRELMRPMLAEWLDKNLPGMVEKMVQAEIARIAGKRS